MKNQHKIDMIWGYWHELAGYRHNSDFVLVALAGP